MKKTCLLFFIFLGACASRYIAPEYYTNVDKAIPLFSCNYDNFKKTTGCMMPPIYNTIKQIDEQGNSNIVYKDATIYYKKYAVLAMHKEDNLIAIMFSMRNDNWFFYEQAYDNDGNELLFKLLDRKVVNQQYMRNLIETQETFFIIVSKKYLENYKEKELQIKLYGKNGSEIFTIQPALIKAFLHNINLFEKDK